MSVTFYVNIFGPNLKHNICIPSVLTIGGVSHGLSLVLGIDCIKFKIIQAKSCLATAVV